MNKSSIRGATNRTLVVTILILALLLFLGARIGPTYWTEMSMQTALDDLMKAEGARMHKAGIVSAVQKLAAENGVTLTGKDVTVEYGPDPNQIKVRFKYTAQADLIVTTYKRDVEILSNPINVSGEERVRHDTNSQPPADYSPPPPPPPPPPPSAPSAPYNPAGPYPDRAREAGKKIGAEPQ